MNVGIVGCGAVGGKIAYILAHSDFFEEIVLFDIQRERAHAHARDIAHGVALHTTHTRISEGDPFGCDIIVVSAGERRNPNETRESLVSKNTPIVQEIGKKIRDAQKNSFIITVTNPVDVMNYILWKETGIERTRVIGAGSLLDTARFVFLLSSMMSVPPAAISAYVFGQHGEFQVPYFSGVHVQGKKSVFDYAKREEIRAALLREARIIIEGKGATEFGPAQTTAHIIFALVRQHIYPTVASVVLAGEYGYSNLSIGVPLIIGKHGVERILEWRLDEYEKDLFNRGAIEIKTLIEQVYRG